HSTHAPDLPPRMSASDGLQPAAMAEPPAAPPQPLPPLPQPPPMPQIPVAAAPQSFSPTSSSAFSRRRLMAEPPPALPLPLSHGPVSAALLALSSTASSTPPTHGLATPTTRSAQVAQNPRIGDSGEVESRVVAPTAEALPKINSTVGALVGAPLPQISMACEVLFVLGNFLDYLSFCSNFR
uniref:Uncharacterized protein n=3 Tax=Aegilops tauschii subsp. strangulata TaxID=200361 RepID=A0A453AIZ5_AEGTS